MLITIFPNNPGIQGGNTSLAAQITRAGSKQTYYTFRLLADRDRVQDGFRAYAYFRWLDDNLDCGAGTKQDKKAYIDRQNAILEACYRGESPADVNAREQMLVDLVRTDTQEHQGLKIYLQNMMRVMAFDVERCGRTISHAELNEYTHLLSSAVTELLFYLIGHDDAPPGGETRYHAVYGAHIVHMLRDTVEDIAAGYINIPQEYVGMGQLSLNELQSLPVRKWVYERVKLARQYFNIGRKYIDRVKNFRCRLAGYAYLARFEWMLKQIERDGYCLRPKYPERRRLGAILWIVWRMLVSQFKLPWSKLELGKQASLQGVCEE